MGSSERAGNKGEPATPRDGAAVELQGLALRVARGLDRLSADDQFPYSVLKGPSVGPLQYKLILTFSVSDLTSFIENK